MRVTRNMCLLLVKCGRLFMPVYLYLLLTVTETRIKGYNVKPTRMREMAEETVVGLTGRMWWSDAEGQNGESWGLTSYVGRASQRLADECH